MVRQQAIGYIALGEGVHNGYQSMRVFTLESFGAIALCEWHLHNRIPISEKIPPISWGKHFL